MYPLAKGVINMKIVKILSLIGIVVTMSASSCNTDADAQLNAVLGGCGTTTPGDSVGGCCTTTAASTCGQIAGAKYICGTDPTCVSLDGNNTYFTASQYTSDATNVASCVTSGGVVAMGSCTSVDFSNDGCKFSNPSSGLVGCSYNPSVLNCDCTGSSKVWNGSACIEQSQCPAQ